MDVSARRDISGRGADRAKLSPPHAEPGLRQRRPTGYEVMNKQSREALDAYYVEAGSWAEDARDELIRSRRTAWRVAWIAVIAAFLLALALIILMPLK